MVTQSAVVVFDVERAVANAGVMLLALLAQRLGLEDLVEECVDLAGRPGGANPGRNVMSLCSAMVLGADCIDDCDLLRCGQTGAVLGHRIAAPSTLGTFLRSFTFGHVRQLDKVLGLALERAWSAGAGPGTGRLVVDVDSFVGEVHGYRKQGAGYGYTRVLGYHPLLATRADTGEVLHIRLRKGSANTARGMLRFCEELIARVERAGATGPRLLRADSGFWATDHLGYEPHQEPAGGAGNTRNGTTPKTVHTTAGPVQIQRPRDRNGVLVCCVDGLTGFPDAIAAVYPHACLPDTAN